MKMIHSSAIIAILSLAGSAITPAAQASKGLEGDAVENAARQNVREVVAKLKA